MTAPIDFQALLADTVRRPRDAARALMALSVSRDMLSTLFALVVVLSVMFQILAAPVLLVSVEPPPADAVPPAVNPVFAIVEAVFLNAALILGLWKGGELWGGKGTLPETAVLYLYLQTVGFAALITLFLLAVVLPPLAWLLVFAVGIWAIWVNLTFVDELHGFGSLGKSFALFLAVWIGLFLIQSFLFTLAGRPGV